MEPFLMTRGRDDAGENEDEETAEDHGANEALVPSDEDLHTLVDEEGGKWICEDLHTLVVP
jgi:hypothetical protein